MEIKHYQTVASELYDAYLTNNPQANSYHTRAWLEVLQRSYGYQPVSFVALDAQGQICGLLPLMRVQGRVKGRRLVSLPFSHCVPILSENPQIERALLDAALQLCQTENHSYLELKPRAALQHSDFQASLQNHISELDLKLELENIFEQFTASNRRNIRKAERANFEIYTAQNRQDYAAFYGLEVATRRRQGAPVYPRRFFHDMAELLRDDVTLYLAAYEGEIVAGMVVMQRGETCIYGYGAALRTEALKGLYPSNLLIWEAIQQAKAAGCTLFDFGTTPLHNQGLLEFKQRYAPALNDLPYWYYLHSRAKLPTINREGRAVKWVERLLKTLPRPLFERLSPYLLREVG